MKSRPVCVAVFVAQLVCAVGCADVERSSQAIDEESRAELDGGSATQTEGCLGVSELEVGALFKSESGSLGVELRALSPQRVRKGENDWTVVLVDDEGQPLSQAELTAVRPFMPAHGHDGRFAPVLAAGEDAATFSVRRINLWMSGVWEVTFTVRLEAREERVVVRVCVPS